MAHNGGCFEKVEMGRHFIVVLLIASGKKLHFMLTSTANKAYKRPVLVVLTALIALEGENKSKCSFRGVLHCSYACSCEPPFK